MRLSGGSLDGRAPTKTYKTPPVKVLEQGLERVPGPVPTLARDDQQVLRNAKN